MPTPMEIARMCADYEKRKFEESAKQREENDKEEKYSAKERKVVELIESVIAYMEKDSRLTRYKQKLENEFKELLCDKYFDADKVVKLYKNKKKELSEQIEIIEDGPIIAKANDAKAFIGKKIECLDVVYEVAFSDLLAYMFAEKSKDKKLFLERLNNTNDPMELARLYSTYEVKLMSLDGLKRSVDILSIQKNIDEYIEFFDLGKTLIHQRANELNINIGMYVYLREYISNYIDERKYNQALMYFYEVDSVEKIKQTKKEEKYIENKNIGNIGEEVVEYALSWLDEEYIRIPAESEGKYGQKCILIQNLEYKAESQEYDHIVVGPQGIFLIETKNYAGDITIDEEGNWIREKNDGSVKGERNPIQQVRRHEKLMKSIVGDINVISVICLSHPNVILYGAENSSIKVLKSDLLCEYIENYKTDILLTAEEIDAIVNKIREYMI